MTPIKYYSVDLSKTQPAEKWDHVILDHLDKFPNLVQEIRSFLQPYSTMMTGIRLALFLAPKSAIFHYDEIEYFSKAIGLEFHEILVMQLIYELSSACTTGVMSTPHGPLFFRTMDWEMDFLKRLTIGLDLTRGGRPVGRVLTWVGYVGYLTAMTDSYNIAINYRRTQDLSVSSILNNLYRIITRRWPVGYLVREIIDREMSASAAKMTLQESQLVTPCYITLHCKDQSIDSVVITRDPQGSADVRTTDLVQCNVDHDKEEPNILYSLERRSTFRRIERGITPLDSLDEIVKPLTIFPIVNDHTIYVYYECGDVSRSWIPAATTQPVPTTQPVVDRSR